MDKIDYWPKKTMHKSKWGTSFQTKGQCTWLKAESVSRGGHKCWTRGRRKQWNRKNRNTPRPVKYLKMDIIE